MEQKGHLDGHVVVVTGAGRGIGRAISERLGKAHAAVGLMARSEEEVEQAAYAIKSDGGSALALVVDVTNRAAVNNALAKIEDELGGVSVVVNNAGTLDAIGPLWEADPEV